MNLMIDDRENILFVFLRFENQGQDNGQEHKEGAKTETNIIWTEEINDDCKGQESLHINLIDSPEEIGSWEHESVSSTIAKLMRMGNQK